MAPDQVIRPPFKILSNSAAEFVENRSAQVADRSANDQMRMPEFVTGLDRFIPKDEIPQEEYYKLSTEKMNRFQHTLKSYCKVLEQRNLDSKLSVKIKEPQDYRIEDVLSIAEKINTEKQSGFSKCVRIIRKSFKAAEEREGTWHSLLSFPPTDNYRFTICGGFALILAGVKDQKQIRKDIQTALADIPQKLNNIQRLANLHVMSVRLHACADSVFASIFMLLERIIHTLSRNAGKKMFSVSKDHGSDITPALKDLDDSITCFQTEIDICAQERLRRIEENGIQLQAFLDNMAPTMTGWNENQEKVEGNQQKNLEGRDQTTMEQVQAAVYNTIYRFIASNPAFNVVDSTIANEEKAKANSTTVPPSSRTVPVGSSTGAVIFSIDENKKLVEAWLKDVGDYESESFNNITECLDTAESLDLEEKDKIQYIMDSEELHGWLGRSRSCVLSIEAETAPDTLGNSMSLTTALMAMRLTSIPKFLVLSFFCLLGTTASASKDISGPMEMLQRFNGQFLKFILNERPTVDLSFLAIERYFQKSGKKIKYALTLFHRLLGLLGENDAIFILVDSFSRMSGGEEDGDKIMGRIIDMIASTPNVIIKVLITDPLPGCPLKDQADLSLYIPDHVDGGKHGINLEFLMQGNDAVIQGFQAQRKKVDSGSDEDSEDDD
ncbi:hypothetical protein BDZ45DRAFT_267711 [Acephala macrosclerotiorum]|nr:hypothetical protein BDZ45DRAFT_267711 [Acephala macrosclerotiorum]